MVIIIWNQYLHKLMHQLFIKLTSFQKTRAKIDVRKRKFSNDIKQLITIV